MEHEERSEQQEGDAEKVDDLEVGREDAENVSGGLRGNFSDPDAGGQYA